MESRAVSGEIDMQGEDKGTMVQNKLQELAGKDTNKGYRKNAKYCNSEARIEKKLIYVLSAYLIYRN